MSTKPGQLQLLTFGRCGAYAADQEAGRAAVGWAESYASAVGAREAALAECGSRGGSGCVVRAWGCNGQVVEEGLNLDRAARLWIQQGLQAAGFDPGGADGLFGPRTRAAIRAWQSSRGARATGYLDGPAVEALRSSGASDPAVEPPVTPSLPPAATATEPATPATAAAELEGLFWQSVMNSTNPAEFEAYLRRFPTGVLSELAQARVESLRTVAAAEPGTTGTGTGSAETPASGAAEVEVRRVPGEVFRDCPECPEMVVMPDGRLALGRYEVTVGEYQEFTAANRAVHERLLRRPGL